jgi:predicted nucleic acid-binding protein
MQPACSCLVFRPLYRQWHPSHGIDVNDAFLAATAMKTGGKIVTLNVKHFPMTDLVVEKAW